MGETREERRRRERAEQRRRDEEIEKLREEPRLPEFEAPAKGVIVDSKPPPKPKGS